MIGRGTRSKNDFTKGGRLEVKRQKSNAEFQAVRQASELQSERFPLTTKTISSTKKSTKSLKFTEKKRKTVHDADRESMPVTSGTLFVEGIDDIVFQGDVMKFKPGLSANFVPRYMQISKRAIRYFKSNM